MKYCPRCYTTKEDSEFYRDRTSKDGLHSWCKSCVKAVQKMYKQTPKGKEAARKYSRSEKGRERNKAFRLTVKYKEIQKRFRQSEKGLQHWRRSGAIQYHKHKERCNARSLVWYALKTGTLVRPPVCSYCWLTGDIEAHHEDYSKPLEVFWLCKKCHREIQNKHKRR